MKTLGRASLSSLIKVVLDVAWYLTIAAVALVVLDVLVGLGGASRGRLDLWVWFDLDPAAYHIESAELGVENAVIGEASGKLVFRSTHGALMLAYLALVVVWFGAALAIIYQLRGIFRALVAGEPFARANAARIRFIGIVILAMETAKFFILLGQSLFVSSNFAIEGLTLKVIPRPNLGAILVGLVVLVIAEVFRQGAGMRAEQELTV